MGGGGTKRISPFKIIFRSHILLCVKFSCGAPAHRILTRMQLHGCFKCCGTVGDNPGLSESQAEAGKASTTWGWVKDFAPSRWLLLTPRASGGCLSWLGVLLATLSILSSKAEVPSSASLCLCKSAVLSYLDPRSSFSVSG